MREIDVGDIVLARFPFVGVGEAMLSKWRPALVVEASIDGNLRVAYGTSQRVDRCAPWELSLSEREAEDAGLKVPTKFSFHSFVRTQGGAVRRIGRLPEGVFKGAATAAKNARKAGYI